MRQIARGAAEILVPHPKNPTLTPRLQQLLVEIQKRDRYTTQDHMTNAGVSHRTALRDLQALVRHGVVERVGVRRGAFYRPSRPTTNSSTGNFADG
jgi:DeoR/GlpR family transcriptional regulator of sugar metabolism